MDLTGYLSSICLFLWTNHFLQLKRVIFALTEESWIQVPSWLSGTYVRNGPGQHTFGSEKRQLNNWLDGFPKLHSFKFNGDKVLFSGKMLESKNYMDSVAAGELTPQITLNQFVNPADDWDMFEKFEIFYKVGHLFGNHNMN